MDVGSKGLVSVPQGFVNDLDEALGHIAKYSTKHTESILKELGMTDVEIASMQASKAI